MFAFWLCVLAAVVIGLWQLVVARNTEVDQYESCVQEEEAAWAAADAAAENSCAATDSGNVDDLRACAAITNLADATACYAVETTGATASADRRACTYTYAAATRDSSECEETQTAAIILTVLGLIFGMPLALGLFCVCSAQHHQHRRSLV